MGRGKGVRLQKYKDGGLSDAMTFDLADGLSWKDPAGRTRTVTAELAEWVGARASAGGWRRGGSRGRTGSGEARARTFPGGDSAWGGGFLRRGLGTRGARVAWGSAGLGEPQGLPLGRRWTVGRLCGLPPAEADFVR